MAKKLLENAAAEKEANDIGMRYMNSSDVLGDMKRDYGSALDGVRVHDDAAANARVAAARRDGLASGKDIYMRSGSLSSSAPEVKGLLAHEVAHTMQQSGSTTSQSVDYGSEQGGFLDSFKKIFGRKKKTHDDDEEIANMTISNPQLKSVHMLNRVNNDSDAGTLDVSGMDAASREDELRYHDFLYSKALTPSLANDPKIRARAIQKFSDDVRENVDKYVQQAQAEGKPLDEANMLAAAFRLNGEGTKAYSQLLRNAIPQDYYDQMASIGINGTRDLDLEQFQQLDLDVKAGVTKVEEYLSGPKENEQAKKMLALRDQGYGVMQQVIGAEDSELGKLLDIGHDAISYEGSAITDDEQISATLINFLMNRTVTPDIGDRVKDMRTAEGDTSRSAQQLQEYNKWLQYGVKFKPGDSLEGKSSRGFLASLVSRFRK